MSFDYKDKQMLERMRIDLHETVRELRRIAEALERIAPIGEYTHTERIADALERLAPPIDYPYTDES